MNSFVMNLYDAANELTIEEVSSFMAMDASGSFGIQANHDRFITTLVVGLARFRQRSENWQYLALLGGVLYFKNNVLTLSTRHFFIDPDFDRISTLLDQQLITEEDNLRETRLCLQRMEQALLKRMVSWQRKPDGQQ
ncbi:ATPase, F1 complex, delta/epsilon subunit [Candidatus Methylobacter favarea]|uniref:ATP synthase epsilon chain n=1 Tax=Candidatus Methylobacter favarea TaxID=2707345 RepID=A0A8S0XH58_9GAMM|nr:F0F1 ATP synthase subunit epsilon [Candidatus Methylobacter favarea]CAA9891561.1 ATPase, F1 complex, delta/epsilon subunit [Candidatus Methylobacter favarea]